MLMRKQLGMQYNSNRYNLARYMGIFSSGSYLTFSTKAISVAVYTTTGDYTLECWVYPTSYAGSIHECATTASRTSGYNFYIKTSGFLEVHAYDYGYTNVYVTATSNPVPLNKWTHVAVQKTASSNVIDLFVNGVKATVSNNFYGGYLSISPDSNAINPVKIGRDFVGYISNYRYTKQVLFTGAFTPSKIPLTTSTNGSATGNLIAPTPANVTLLALQSNNVTIDNSSTPRTLVNSGVTSSIFSSY